MNDPSKPLAGRIALVTGASRGIGYATAIALAKAGAHVVATARTVGGLEELDDAIKAAGGTATLVPLELRDTDGIARLAAALDERYRRLDVLVGNAALGASNSPLDHFHPKEWDEVMAVNVTANWHLIRFFNPLLRKSDAGRAVFLTSGSSTNARAYRGLYAAVEGRARHHGAHLRGRDRVDADQGQSVQSGTDAHPHARRGDAGRGSDDAADAGRGGGGDRAALPAGLSRRPASSTTSASRSCCRSAAGVSEIRSRPVSGAVSWRTRHRARAAGLRRG